MWKHVWPHYYQLQKRLQHIKFLKLSWILLGLLLSMTGCQHLENIPPGELALSQQHWHYHLSSHLRDYQIRYLQQETLKPQSMAFVSLFEELMKNSMHNGSLSQIGEEFLPLDVLPQADYGYLLSFDLKDFELWQEPYILRVRLEIEVFFKQQLIFRKTYHAQALSQSKDFFLKSYYPWENIIYETLENNLEQIFAHFLQDWADARDLLAFPEMTHAE